MNPSATRRHAILYLFGRGEDIATQVKLASQQCDAGQSSAWQRGAVVGALGGLAVGAGATRFIAWLRHASPK